MSLFATAAAADDCGVYAADVYDAEYDGADDVDAGSADDADDDEVRFVVVVVDVVAASDDTLIEKLTR